MPWAARDSRSGWAPRTKPLVSGVLGLSYDHPGRNTEEYLRIISALLRGEEVDYSGQDWTTRSPAGVVRLDYEVPLLLSALSPRMLRIAGHFADGVVLWMASASVIESRIAPALRHATTEWGRPPPRIVAGLPVAVHDDPVEARAATAAMSTMYAGMTNYQRVIEAGGGATLPMSRSSATRSRCENNCRTSSMPEPPTSGHSPSASVMSEHNERHRPNAPGNCSANSPAWVRTSDHYATMRDELR